MKMKPLLLLPILLGLITLPSARADQKEEDAAIHRRHDEWAAAWNKHDPKLMAAFFVADGDLINPFGRHAQGTAGIEKPFSHGNHHAVACTTSPRPNDKIRYIGEKMPPPDAAGECSRQKKSDGR